MSSHRVRLRPRLIIPERKHETDQSPPNLKGGAGHLSPDLKPNTPPVFPENECENHIECIGKYLLLEPLDSCEKFQIFKSVHIETQEEFTCKVIPIENYRKTLSAYWRVDAHENITQIEEIVLGETKAYVFFARSHGDLHSYVRSKRKLKELEAARLFHQVVKAVCFCHENGVILRDLKLRKFVFKNEERTELMLEGLEDACVLDDESNDVLGDKHGCPAYVSPEILTSTEGYSGKSADIWSLGVMLYTVLIGRYPFHDTEPGALFTKIRRGQYSIPDSISSRAKCLIRSLLRRSPDERLTADEVLQHPWFKIQPRVSGSGAKERKNEDQAVPMIFTMDDDPLFL